MDEKAALLEELRQIEALAQSWAKRWKAACGNDPHALDFIRNIRYLPTEEEQI